MTNGMRCALCACALSLTLAGAALGAKRPVWLSGPDPRYPSDRYATGVGTGDTLDAARANARAEIARGFQTRVRQTYHHIESETTGSDLHRETDVQTRVDTDILLEGVVIAQTHRERKTGQHHALAVLDKSALKRDLSAKILDQEQTIQSARSRAAAATDPTQALREMSRALRAGRARDDLVRRRRLVDPAPSLEMEDLSTARLTAEWDRLASALPVFIQATAPEGSALADAVRAAVTGVGLRPGPVNGAGWTLAVSVTVHPFDRGHPQWTYFQWKGTVSVTDTAAERVVAASAPEGIEGHTTVETARARTLLAADRALADETARLLKEFLFQE